MKSGSECHAFWRGGARCEQSGRSKNVQKQALRMVVARNRLNPTRQMGPLPDCCLHMASGRRSEKFTTPTGACPENFGTIAIKERN